MLKLLNKIELRLLAIREETWLKWHWGFVIAFVAVFLASIPTGLCLAFLWPEGLWIEGVLIGSLVHLEIFACLTGIFACMKSWERG